MERQGGKVRVVGNSQIVRKFTYHEKPCRLYYNVDSILRG